MPKTKEQKKVLVDEYKNKIENAKAVYIINAEGINVIDTTDLKKKLYDVDSSYGVVKNRLFKIALNDQKLEQPEAYVTGQNAVIFSNEEKMTEVAKLVYEFLKDRKEFEIKGGYLDKKVISKDQVIELAKLPGKQELLAKLVGTLNAPIANFVYALSGNIKNFVFVLNAVKDKKSNL